MHCFSLVVCRRVESNQWLTVQENKNRGYWLPGGFVENGDDHIVTAHKETKEEAGVDIELKGILRVENEMTVCGGRQRVIFYAEPRDPNQPPKSIPDAESMGATWVSLDQLKQLQLLPPPEGLRGPELLHWAQYIENGGTIYPLSVFSNEHEPIPER